MPRATRLAPHQLDVGAVLRERYELQALLGRGGMGAVYKALDRYRASLGLPDRHVALKIAAALPGGAGTRALGREFQSAQQLSHPNVINVYEIDHEGDVSFYTMELLEGARLSEVLQQAPAGLALRTALAIIRDVGAAVAHAHSRGIVHGDLKPQNVFITDSGQVRVLDFGGNATASDPWIGEPPLTTAASGPLAPSAAPAAGVHRWDDALDLGPYLAATPAYASCEQLEGQPPDARDDLYALACISYQLLTGRHPFDGKSSLQARALRLRPARPRVLRADAWKALRQGLSLDRAHRTLDLDVWLRALGVHEAIEHLPPHWQHSSAAVERPGRRRLATAAVLLAGLAAAGWLLAQQGAFDAPGLLSSARDTVYDAWQMIQTQASNALGVTPPSAAAPPLVPSRRPAPASSAEPSLPANPGAPVALERADSGPVAAPSAAASEPDSPLVPRAGAAAFDQHADAQAAAAATSGATPAPSAAVTFSAPSYEVSGSAAAARIVVTRVGNTHGEVPFVWWTEAASAKPDVDYAPLGRRVELIPRGRHNVTIFVPIISNPLRQRPTQFYVALGRPHVPGASDTPSARATVTIGPRG